MRICLNALDHNRSSAPLSNQCLGECIKAREGMALIIAHLDTQLPFAYVHLICLLVNLQNVVFAIQSGMHCSISYAKGETGSVIQQVVSCLLIGVIYQAIFGITYVILDPFGDDAMDFPQAVFTAYNATLVDAVLKAQQPCPVVVQDGRLVQPRPRKHRKNDAQAALASQSKKPASQGPQTPQGLRSAGRAPQLVPPAQPIGNQQVSPGPGRLRQMYE